MAIVNDVFIAALALLRIIGHIIMAIAITFLVIAIAAVYVGPIFLGAAFWYAILGPWYYAVICAGMFAWTGWFLWWLNPAKAFLDEL